jgi:hypothetical protein
MGRVRTRGDGGERAVCRVGKRRAESAQGDPWVLAEARKLGFEPDPTSVCVVGTGWHLVAMALLLPTLLSTARNRILIFGPSRSTLFKANVTREDPTELIWGWTIRRHDMADRAAMADAG